jgi:hypothetical protein
VQGVASSNPATSTKKDKAWDINQETAMTSDASALHTLQFEIRFQSLFQEGRGMAFPCDAAGRVNLEDLSERGRSNYLFARAMVGREYATPNVRAA